MNDTTKKVLLQDLAAAKVLKDLHYTVNHTATYFKDIAKVSIIINTLL